MTYIVNPISMSYQTSVFEIILIVCFSPSMVISEKLYLYKHSYPIRMVKIITIGLSFLFSAGIIAESRGRDCGETRPSNMFGPHVHWMFTGWSPTSLGPLLWFRGRRLVWEASSSSSPDLLPPHPCNGILLAVNLCDTSVIILPEVKQNGKLPEISEQNSAIYFNRVQ